MSYLKKQVIGISTATVLGVVGYNLIATGQDALGYLCLAVGCLVILEIV